MLNVAMLVLPLWQISIFHAIQFMYWLVHIHHSYNTMLMHAYEELIMILVFFIYLCEMSGFKLTLMCVFVFHFEIDARKHLIDEHT